MLIYIFIAIVIQENPSGLIIKEVPSKSSLHEIGLSKDDKILGYKSESGSFNDIKCEHDFEDFILKSKLENFTMVWQTKEKEVKSQKTNGLFFFNKLVFDNCEVDEHHLKELLDFKKRINKGENDYLLHLLKKYDHETEPRHIKIEILRLYFKTYRSKGYIDLAGEYLDARENDVTLPMYTQASLELNWDLALHHYSKNGDGLYFLHKSLYIAMGFSRGERQALNIITNILAHKTTLQQGATDVFIEWGMDLLEKHPSTKSTESTAVFLHNTANSYADRDNHDDAIHFYIASLETIKERNNKKSTIRKTKIWNSLAPSLLVMDRQKEATQALERAICIRESPEINMSATPIKLNLASLEARRGNRTKSLELLLEIKQKEFDTLNRDAQLSLLSNIPIIYTIMGAHEEALKEYKFFFDQDWGHYKYSRNYNLTLSTLPISLRYLKARYADIFSEAVCIFNMNFPESTEKFDLHLNYASLNNDFASDKGAMLFRKALTYARTENNVRTCLYNLARSYKAIGDFERAMETSYLIPLDDFDEITQRTLALLFELHMLKGEIEVSRDYAHALAYYEDFAEVRPVNITDAKSKRKKRPFEYGALLAAKKGESKDGILYILNFLKKVEGVTSNNIDLFQRVLERSEESVYFFAIELGEDFAYFIVSKRQVFSKILEGKSAFIKNQTSKISSLIKNKEDMSKIYKEAKVLLNLFRFPKGLFGSSSGEIVFTSFGPLSNFPLSLLIANSTDDSHVRIATRLAHLDPSESQPIKNPIGISRSCDNLHFSDKEMLTASLFTGEPFLVVEEKEALLSNLESTNFLHFSTHAIEPPNDHPYLSLGCTSVDKLTSEQIYSLDFSNKYVIISSCNSSSTKTVSELSLSDAFLLAGARLTVASLWEVNDMASWIFFEHFYHFLTLEDNYAKALQKTKSCFKSGKLYRPFPEVNTEELQHPYYWSGFQIYGSSD